MRKQNKSLGTISAALVAASVLGFGAPQLATVATAFASDSACPVCDLEIVDSEAVRMTVGGKAIGYRCVLCAIAEAKSEYPESDVTISAPSEKSTRITIKRVKGKWSASPASAVFLKDGKHRSCHIGYHAFTNKVALAAWAKRNGFENKPLSLAQMVAVSK
jgi:hypothetical protein